MTEDVPAQPAGEESVEPRPRRRRRRGGRGRGAGRTNSQSSTEERSSQAEEQPKDQQGGSTTGSRRRSGGGSSGSKPRGSTSGDGARNASKQDAPADESSQQDTKEKSGTAGTRSSGSSRSGPRRRRRSGSGSRTATKPKGSEASGDGDAAGRRSGQDSERGQKQTAGRTEAPAAEAGTDDGAQGEPTTAARRRRRRRRRKPTGGSGQGNGQATPTEGAGAAASVTKAPADLAPGDGGKATKSPRPTRTSRAGRRGGPLRRRRQPAVQVSRRTGKTMLMTEREGRVEVVVLEEGQLVEHYVTRSGAQSMAGNVYLGRVQSVLPGMEAAFVDVGRGRNAVLYAGEVSYDEDVEAGDRRIEHVLKQGQSVVVQVTKDPLKGKGARLTAQVSLPGRYLVYVPDGGASGISRRLPEAERERLRTIMKKIRPSEAGVIIRTAAEGATEEELAADLERLKKTWESIRRKSRRARAPKVLYEEPELLERVVRDVFSPAEFGEIVTESREIHDRVRNYLADVAPDDVDLVKLHEGSLPLFEAFHVTEQIHKALERKVWLPSGGYLVIDRAEAMTVIDVNTGKHVGKTNLEETVVGTNLEAAREIPRQLRLRDIGGIIIVDFIDMTLQGNREQVVQELREELAHDKTRSQVFDITPLGLLELTRKKVSAGLLEAYSETCPTCEGRGILLTHEI